MKASLRLVRLLRPGLGAKALEQRFQNELTIYVSRRSDSLLPQSKGQPPPLTERDLERDAELQEVTRAFFELRATARRDRRNLYVLWSLTTVMFAVGLVRFAWDRADAPPVARNVSAANSKPLPVAAAPAASASAVIVDQAVASEIVPDRVIRDATGGVRTASPVASAASAPVPSPVRSAVPSPARLVDAKPGRAPAPAPAVAPAPAAPAAGSEAQKVFSIDGGAAPQTPAALPFTSAGGSTATNTAAAAPAVSPRPASVEEGATRPIRRIKYGHAGVITLTETGAVVFDADRRAQRMVPVGGELPDGSVLRSVDSGAGRISTDKGEIQFVQ